MHGIRWWLNWFCGRTCGAIALSLTFSTPSLADSEPRPRIHPEARSLDLGELLAGETAEAIFRIQNRGNADLIIHDVQSSCGCTTASLTDAEKTIAPGEVRKLVARFDSAKLLGLQRKTVTLTSNDPEEPRTTLILLADVVTLFRVEPGPLLNLRSARRGEALPPLDLFPTDPNLRLEDVTVDLPEGLLDYGLEPIERADGVEGIRVTFLVPRDRDLGPVESKVRLGGIVSGEPAEMDVRVTGQVIGDLTVHPAMVQSLQPTMRGRRFAPVFIAATNDLPFSVLSAEAGPHVDVRTESRANGKEHTIHTILRESAPDGPLAATLRIRTDNTGQPVLDVPIFVQVRPRYLIEPRMVLLGPQVGRRVREVRLSRPGNHPFGIRAVSCDNPALTCAAVDSGARRRGHVLRIALADAVGRLEDFDATVTVTLDQPGESAIEIDVEYRQGKQSVNAMTLTGSATGE